MKRSYRIWIGAAILIVGAVCVSVLVSLHQKDEGSIQIGGVYALTGKGASFGKDVKNGVDLAVEMINQAGGVNGLKLRVISEDTQSDSKNAVSAFEKLIRVNKITAAVGFITSSEALACAPVAERAKVVMITPIAGTPKLREAGDYVFRTRESGLLQSYKIAEYIYEDLRIHEAAILYENAANAVGYRDAFVSRFEQLGGTITSNLSYEEGQTDFRLVLTQLKATQPIAVYLPGVGKVIGRVLKQATELGLETRLFSSAGIEDSVLFEIAGDAANGVVYGAPAFSLGSNEPATKLFIEEYRKKYGREPSVYAANAYDAINLIAAAMRSNRSGGEGIRDFLYGVKGYRAASGVLTFDKYGEVTKPTVLKKTHRFKFVDLSE